MLFLTKKIEIYLHHQRSRIREKLLFCLCRCTDPKLCLLITHKIQVFQGPFLFKRRQKIWRAFQNWGKNGRSPNYYCFVFFFCILLIFINSKLLTFFINKHNSHTQTDTVHHISTYNPQFLLALSASKYNTSTVQQQTWDSISSNDFCTCPISYYELLAYYLILRFSIKQISIVQKLSFGGSFDSAASLPWQPI